MTKLVNLFNFQEKLNCLLLYDPSKQSLRQGSSHEAFMDFSVMRQVLK